MEEELLNFINNKSFPCVMAKLVKKKGRLKVLDLETVDDQSSRSKILSEMYEFVDTFRADTEKLSSFIVVLKDPKFQSFPVFEEAFWNCLSHLGSEDKKNYPHDPRVSATLESERFSFSLKSEAFFILALHPESPRWSRRFKYPAIVFNPHIQFEKLREKGIFRKVRDVIRQRDKLLQGSINPMLNDFGSKSEVFQYLGRIYGDQEPVPLTI